MADRKKRCLYNFDMTAAVYLKAAWLSLDDDLTREGMQGFIHQLRDTDVDTVCVSPVLLRLPLWRSQVEPHWQNEAPAIPEPRPGSKVSALNIAYFRYRKYILGGGDPVGDLRDAIRASGRKFFISLRMNDQHGLWDDPDSLHIDSFYRAHPEYRIGDFEGEAPALGLRTAAKQMVRCQQDYLRSEVREHYLALLDELLTLYPADGVELEGMSWAWMFDPNRLDEGTAAITDFVRRARAIADRHGTPEGNRPELSFVLPTRADEAAKVGFDAAAWAAEGLVDIFHLYVPACTSLYIDVEGYRRLAPQVMIVPQMCNQVDRRNEMIPASDWRMTTAEIYRTVAREFYERGADGVALYNFDFTRDYHWDRSTPGVEPPVYCLKGITDPAFLQRQPSHFLFAAEWLTRAQDGSGDVTVCFPLHRSAQRATGAVLRLVSDKNASRAPLTVRLNGQVLEEFIGTGELFSPCSRESLPHSLQTRYFRVPLSLLRPEQNTLTVHNNGLPRAAVPWKCVELAIYR